MRKRPLIIADSLGRNPKTVPALIELAELLAVPVVDKGGRFNFPSMHPLDVTDGAREILQKADFILALDVADLFGALDDGEQTNPRKRIHHFCQCENRQHLDE